MHRLTQILLVLAWASTAFGMQENLVGNGSFELGSFGFDDRDTRPEFYIVDEGDTSLTGWAITGSAGSHWMDQTLGPVDGLMTDGVRSLDLQGFSGEPTTVSTSIETTIGAEYILTFDAYGSNLLAAQNWASVSAGTLVDEEFFPPNGPRQVSSFDTFTYRFAATGTTTVLTFQVTNSDGFGPTIDNVAVVAVPDACPHDADGDGRVDIEDLYHLTQNPADINGDGVADADDTRCLEAYLRCVERLDMSFRPGDPAADGSVPFASYRQTVTGAGLQQLLRVIREPSPDGIGCVSQSWTTTLVGMRPGQSGPVEIRLERDGFLWKRLWADAAAASPGNQQRRGMLTCEGSAVEYVAASPSVAVGSADAARALILLDGMNISGTAMLKGIADPATRVIGGGLLDPYVDVDGNITLPTRGMLVCFELDPVDQSNSAFAFDDVVLLVDNECGGVQTPATARYVYDYEQLETGPLLGQDGWSAVSFAGPTSLSVFDNDPDLFGMETKSLGYVGFQGVTNFGRRPSSSDFPINELPLGSSSVTLSFDSCVEFCSGNNSSVTFYVYNDSNGSGQVEPFELLFGFGYNHVGPSNAGNGVVANTPSAYLFRPGGGTTPDNISADLRNYTAIVQDQGFTIQFILEIDTSDPMNYTADLSFRPINQGPASLVSPPELQGIDLLLGAADFIGDIGIITRIDAQLSNCGQCCPSCLAMDNLELLLVD